MWQHLRICVFPIRFSFKKTDHIVIQKNLAMVYNDSYFKIIRFVAPKNFPFEAYKTPDFEIVFLFLFLF